MAIKFAIIGSGPSGIYCAESLTRLMPEAEIDIFESRPYAFGLLRCAVAPDHLATKALLRVFDRVANRGNVKLHLGVTIGQDKPFAELEEHYDAVIVAAGAQEGKRLDIQREEGANPVSAFEFARAFNGCASAAVLPATTVPIRNVCIVGSGNASLDVARLLMTPTGELSRFNVPDAVLEWHSKLRLQEIRLIARGTESSAKFSPNELAAVEKCGSVRLCFSLRPIRHMRDALVCVDGEGLESRFPCDFLVEAIGQVATLIPGLPRDPVTGALQNESGRVTGRRATFAVGWSAGRQLNIAAMREDAKRIAFSVSELMNGNK